MIRFYKISKPGHIFWDTQSDLLCGLSSLFPNSLSFLTSILFLIKCLAKISFSWARLSFGNLVHLSDSDWDRHCIGPQLWLEALSLIFEVSITLFSLFWPVNKFKCLCSDLYVKTRQSLAENPGWEAQLYCLGGAGAQVLCLVIQSLALGSFRSYSFTFI